MINGQSTFEVKICRFATFGSASESFTSVQFYDLEYDELTIDGRVPEFSFKLTNVGGLARATWRQSDIVKIYKNRELVFTGSISTTKPNKSAGGQVYEIAGVHYYYRLLLDNFTNGSSELVDFAPNIWRYGRKKQVDENNDEQLINGINPSKIVQALTGNKLITQEFFDNMGGIDNVNWVKSIDGFTDYTTARLTNPGFEGGSITPWVYFEKTRSGSGTDASPYTTNFSGSNSFANGGNVSDNPKEGTKSYRVTFPASTAYNQEDGAGVYQDGVTLEPGDTIFASFKSVTNTAEILASAITARIYVFANGSFNEPNTGVANTPLLAGQQIGGTNSTYIKVGGSPLLKQSGTYRVAVSFAWKASSATNGTTAQDLRVDDVRIIRGNQFTNVSLVDGYLKLKEIAASTSYFEQLFDSGTLAVNGWTEVKPSGSITITADSRFPSGKSFVRLISAANVTPTSMDRNLTLPYSEDFTLDFEAAPAQTNKVCYPLVLTGKDKNGVTRTIKPIVFGSDGNLYYNTTGSNVIFTGPKTYTTAFQKFRVNYYASRGQYIIYKDSVKVGEILYGSLANANAIVQFTNLGCAASDASESATLDVNDYIMTTAFPPKKYVTSGTAQTKDYYVGRPTLKKLPYFTGTTSVTVLAYPYYSEPTLATVYKPQLKLIYKAYNYLTTVDATVATTAFLTPFSETVVAGDGLTEYVYTYDTTALPSDADKLRLEFTLTGDGNGTPRVDYYLLDADVENYNRQVSIVSNQQVYREAITGISSDITGIDEYVFPSDLLAPGTAPTIYNTFAMEFLNTPFLRCVEEVLGNTLKPEALTSADLPGLPATRTLTTQDSNWDFQVDNVGKVYFQKHIGSYYGKYAGTGRKEYSFKTKNLRAISAVEEGNEVINQLVYIGQGIAGVNNIVTNPTLTVTDEASINEFGLKVGRVTEKRAFDTYGNVGRAYAILRQRRSPTMRVTVELLAKFIDQWTVGDIIYIRDLDSDIDDDFRVLSKTTKVSGSGGESVIVELSTKNKTIDSFTSTLGQTLNSLNASNQGVSFTAVGGSVPKPISRDVPYILQVEVPTDAEESLLRILLDAHSEAISSTTVVLQSSTHVHDVTIPALPITIPSQQITIPALNVNTVTSGLSSIPLTYLGVQTTFAIGPAGAMTATSYNGFFGTSYEELYFTLDFFAQYDKDIRYKFEIFSGSEAMTSGTVRTGSSEASGGRAYINFLYPYSYTANTSIQFYFYGESADASSSYTATLRAWGKPKHTHQVIGATTAVGAATQSQQVATTSQTVAGGAAPGGAHTHPTDFAINYKRDTEGRLLFPTNISVAVNDILGIGQVATLGNSGILPDLVGLGKHELGDDKVLSQSSGVGFRLQKYDISHAFKDTNGAWITGTHYLFFNAHGLENQVNQQNLGVMQASVYYDVARRYNSDLVPPGSGPQL